MTLVFVTASEAGFEDVSEPDGGLISQGDEVEDLVARTQAELGPVIRDVASLNTASGNLFAL
jgi:hypothetical protein